MLDPGPGFRIVGANDAFLRSTLTQREALEGRDLLDAFPNPPENLALGRALLESLERVRASGAPDPMPIQRYDLPVGGRSGGAMERHLWLPVNSPVSDRDGVLRYIVHGVEDVTRIATEREESARQRDEAIRKLEIANEELEAFGYSASHDLRSPLRAIDGFCQLLMELHSQGLDPEGRELLARIDTSVRRMGTIIDGLLELSRIAKSKLDRRGVDLSELARNAAAELAARDPARQVTVAIAGGLHALGDVRMLSIAISNLLDNAWKYTARRADARIEVGHSPLGSRNVFYVSDNGAGFDMAQAQRLFTPFTRLHNASQFPGHGIGLATVKRIVERHGGHVWAEAHPDRGATIRFTLGEEPA